MSSLRGWAPDSPTITQPVSPKASLYSQDMCAADAERSGLDAHALRMHVEATLDAQTGLRDEQLDRFLRAHRVTRPDGISRLDKARILAGVPAERVAPGHTLPSPGSGSAPGSPLSSSAHDDRSTSPPPMSLGRGLVSVPPSSCCALATVPPAESSAESSRRRSRSSIHQPVDDEPSATAQPLQTSAARRAVQHLATAVQPLLPLAAAALSTSSTAAYAQSATAAAAAVSGYAQSTTTHEHHAQAQEMSRRLQAAAMQQDKLHHEQAQGLSARLQERAMAQDARQHRQSLWTERQQHAQALQQERRLHREALRVDHRLHFEGILATLREQDREADHDMWEQRTERFQMLMTVSSLLTAGSFALAVEGQLPAEPGCWDLHGSNTTDCLATSSELGDPVLMFEVAALHYFLLGLGLGMQLVTIMGCLALTGRFAEFMDLRVQKQQLLNKDLRRAAIKLTGSGVGERNQERDEKTIETFEKALRRQYVIETCEAGHPKRHVWNFEDWYKQRCHTLCGIVEIAFRIGMFSILGSIMTFMFSILRRGDPEESVQSAAAWQGFAWTLGTLIVLAILIPQFVGSSWSWRLRVDRCRGGFDDGHEVGGRGLLGCLYRWVSGSMSLFADHRQVRFDIGSIPTAAEALFKEIDTNQDGTLDAKELRQAAKRARVKAVEKRKEAERAALRARTPPQSRRHVPTGTRLDGTGSCHRASLGAILGPGGGSGGGSRHEGSGGGTAPSAMAAAANGTATSATPAAAAASETTSSSVKPGMAVGLDDLRAPQVFTGEPIVLPQDGQAAGTDAEDSAWYVEHSTVLSPNQRAAEQRDLEQEAAAAAVLETIIRQLAARLSKRKPVVTTGSSGRGPRRTATPSSSSPPPAPARELPLLQRLRARARSRVAAPDITKEEWDEAISQALY